MLTFISVIFANYPLQVPSYNDSVIGGAFYESISRVAWSAALAWLVFACTQGYGGPVNWFLSLVGWQPLARMSYSIFLVHLPLQLILAAQVKTGTYFGNTQAVSGKKQINRGKYILKKYVLVAFVLERLWPKSLYFVSVDFGLRIAHYCH